MSNQRNRDQEGNLGQTGTDPDTPAGTSGRTGDTGTQNWQQGHSDTNRQGHRPNRHADDDEAEDSGVGNRTGLL